MQNGAILIYSDVISSNRLRCQLTDNEIQTIHEHWGRDVQVHYCFFCLELFRLFRLFTKMKGVPKKTDRASSILILYFHDLVVFTQTNLSGHTNIFSGYYYQSWNLLNNSPATGWWQQSIWWNSPESVFILSYINHASSI